MSKVRFQRVGQVAGPSYPANPLTDIRQVVEPPAGPHRDFLTSLGWPFNGDERAAYRTTLLSRTFFDLLDAGLLAALDFLFLSNGRDVPGSLRNWVMGNPAAGGGSSGLQLQGGALRTDGVASFLSFDLNGPHRQQWQLQNAAAFVYATVTPPAPIATSPLIGSITIGRDALRLHRNSSSPFQQIRMNATSGQGALAPAIAASHWRPGLWAAERIADVYSLLRDGVALGSGAVTGQVLPSEVAVGRGGEGATYAQQSFTAFGGGRALTSAEWASLNTILSAHASEVQALAA